MAARNGALALAAAAALLLLASSAAADSVEGTTTKVDVALYYESLCPYSARFVVNHLANVFTNGLLDAIDLTLLPYGNAQVGAGGKISCQAFNVLRRNGVNVQMISQGASKVNISLVVNDSEAKQCVQALHSAFFENGFLSEVEGADVPQNGSSLNSNGAIYGN